METNEQGLTTAEKVMFILLGIILLIAIGVLIINSFKKDTNLDNNETPITETSGQKDNIVDDNTNEPEDILIEEEPEVEEKIIYPVVNIPSSSGNEIEEDQSIPKPIAQPVVLDWTFKPTIATSAISGDVITIDKNVLLTNGEEVEANLVVMKLELDSWITQDITSGTLTVQEGLYKFIYSYGSSTKELLLTVKNKLNLDTISILKLNETINENSSIPIEEFTKYQTIISNSVLENVEGINKLTINNYIETNNLLPLVLTTNEDLTNKIISTNTLGITITKEQKDWHEEITPNSILIWLDLNTIDITNNVINLEIDGVTYNLELNIIINLFEESTDTDDSELDNSEVVNEETKEDETLPQDENSEDNSNEEDNSSNEQISNDENQEDESSSNENLEDNSNEEDNSSNEQISNDEDQEDESSSNENLEDNSNEEDNSSNEQTSNKEDNEEIVDNEENEDNEEEKLDPLEPVEDEEIENSSNNIDSNTEEQIEDNNLQPESSNISNTTP